MRVPRRVAPAGPLGGRLGRTLPRSTPALAVLPPAAALTAALAAMALAGLAVLPSAGAVGPTLAVLATAAALSW